MPDAGMTTIIAARRFGRMANRLTMASVLAAVAEEHGCRLVVPTLQPHAASFAGLQDNSLCVYPRPPRPWLIDRLPPVAGAMGRLRAGYQLASLLRKLTRGLSLASAAHIDERAGNDELVSPDRLIAALSDPRIRYVFVRDWYVRAPDLVVRHAAAIRAFFQPAPDVAARAAAPVRRLRERADTVVGVHIRHGDYRYPSRRPPLLCLWALCRLDARTGRCRAATADRFPDLQRCAGARRAVFRTDRGSRSW